MNRRLVERVALAGAAAVLFGVIVAGLQASTGSPRVTGQIICAALVALAAALIAAAIVIAAIAQVVRHVALNRWLRRRRMGRVPLAAQVGGNAHRDGECHLSDEDRAKSELLLNSAFSTRHSRLEDRPR